MLLVLLFPLVQKQWLNLYLFDINNFTIYKILYYLSGLIVPTVVIINSLNKFSFYKFDNHKTKNSFYISGKLLFLITSFILIIFSFIISSYIIINLKIFLDLFIDNNQFLVQLDNDKQILTVIVISILLIFEKTKLFLKKVLLINFFIFSIIIWYSQFNNSLLIDIVPFHIFKFKNINFININFLLAIEIIFYLWSYISYGSFLSDWRVPVPYKKEVSPILYILIFYLLIILYYSILFK